MLTWWQVYLWTRLDGIRSLFIIGVVILLIGLFFYVVILADSSYDWEDIKKWFFLQLSLGVLFLLLSVAIPSKEDFALIYVLPKIVNNEKVQQIPEKFLDVANKKLDEMLDKKK